MSADEEQPTLSQAGYRNVSPGLGATKSNVCANCGAQLQADQRYCVECGTRRGQARFKLGDVPSTNGAGAAAPAAAAARGAGTSRWSAGLGLVSVIAVLLLAVGVGVLIGHQGGSGSASNGTQKIVVSGAGNSGAAGATAGTAGTAGSASSQSSTPASSGSAAGKKAASTSSSATTKKIVIPKATKKELKAVDKAQGQSFGSSSQTKLASPTQKVNGSCTNGTAGCKNGKFTGGFFSGN